ncbi:MAG: PhzF family phenazine biosynthesis isomerase [Candidatus Aminicenantes bacterium]|nr:PhzF family phenazine biosynthesis isomerase [Candidatus Aminicenantes bacterium]
MEKRPFYIVDVFAEEKFAGNQLAVFRNPEGLSDSGMQRIAKEMNYSETTFILSEEEKDRGYDVRIFTPEKELPFAGHPTLGTAYVIQQEIIRKPVEMVNLNLKIGQIPVTFNYSQGQPDILWMKQKHPVFGQILDKKAVSSALGIEERDMDERFPVEEVSTGVFSIIAPLKTLEAVKRTDIKKDAYFALIESTEAKAILIFCPETYKRENDLNVRFFAEALGVIEDPATGSANGCLAGYLVKNRYFGQDRIDLRAEQGYEIGRPSLLYLKAGDKEGKIEVLVGGKVFMVARGEFI